MKRIMLLIVFLLVMGCSSEKNVPEDPAILIELGVMHANQGEYDSAKKQFKRVLDMDLRHETARNNLALIYFKEGNYTKAEEHFTYLTQLNPDNPSYHYDLAIALAEDCKENDICEWDRAISEFEIAENISPGFQKAKENAEALKSIREVMNSTNSTPENS